MNVHASWKKYVDKIQAVGAIDKQCARFKVYACITTVKFHFAIYCPIKKYKFSLLNLSIVYHRHIFFTIESSDWVRLLNAVVGIASFNAPCLLMNDVRSSNSYSIVLSQYTLSCADPYRCTMRWMSRIEAWNICVGQRRYLARHCPMSKSDPEFLRKIFEFFRFFSDFFWIFLQFHEISCTKV